MLSNMYLFVYHTHSSEAKEYMSIAYEAMGWIHWAITLDEGHCPVTVSSATFVPMLQVIFSGTWTGVYESSLRELSGVLKFAPPESTPTKLCGSISTKKVCVTSDHMCKHHM